MKMIGIKRLGVSPRWHVFWSLFGGVAWGVWMFFPELPLQASLIGRLMLFCPLVLFPLVLSIFAKTDTFAEADLHDWLSWIGVCAPFAAWLGVFAFAFPVGKVGAALACPWFFVTAALAHIGWKRWWRRGALLSGEMCVDAGCLYLLVGGMWFVITRAGHDLGYGHVIARLTAVHFHYAGFSAPVLAGLLGRLLSDKGGSVRRWYMYAALGLTAAPFLIAIGITLSPLVEFLAALFLISSVLTLAVLTVCWGLSRVTTSSLWMRWFVRVLLFCSSLCSVVAMGFACLYAYAEIAGVHLISIPNMLLYHGLVNALGFVGAGVLGWFFMSQSTELIHS
ncbi:MAG: hypothetical protein CL920_30315 [Deltaproteobacteria bacterium]|nr:hypothetical protein [Deltaproteobacteria bacterium]MBU53008.1 hypothetical protein [Deltaproteobacteria bacterium]|tara:strand:+ start:3318 stop:4325 length:1008 start_codon:yes stop_codon:yes gene_type:complete